MHARMSCLALQGVDGDAANGKPCDQSHSMPTIWVMNQHSTQVWTGLLSRVITWVIPGSRRALVVVGVRNSLSHWGLS